MPRTSRIEEDFAEAAGIDPTAQQVDEYRAETGQVAREPRDSTGGSGARKTVMPAVAHMPEGTQRQFARWEKQNARRAGRAFLPRQAGV
jgi:hypothetical protein